MSRFWKIIFLTFARFHELFLQVPQLHPFQAPQFPVPAHATIDADDEDVGTATTAAAAVCAHRATAWKHW